MPILHLRILLVLLVTLACLLGGVVLALAASVELAWDEAVVDPPVTGFVVYRQDGCAGGFVARPGMPVAVQTYTDTGLAAGAVMCYQVTALRAAGESVPSATLEVTIPGGEPEPPGPELGKTVRFIIR